MVCTNMKQSSSRFPLGKPARRIVRKRVTGQGTHLYTAVPEVLGFLGRPWQILAGLGRSHFFERKRFGAEITAQPFKHAEGKERKRKALLDEKGSLDAESIQDAILIGNAIFLSVFLLAPTLDIFTRGILRSGNAMIK